MSRSSAWQWLRRHDPNLYALHRAIRVTLVAMTALAITDLVVGSAQLVTFGVFGCFAMLLFADFPGNRAGRLAAYLMLAVVGALLISLGTLASNTWWIGTAGMAAVGFLVAYAGSISAVMAAAGRAALLTFILPVTFPGPPADIPVRLAGWGLAVALSIPAALLLWPPKEHHQLRDSSAAVCRALAGRLAGFAVAVPAPATPTDLVAPFDVLRQALRATTFRPVALTTGSRLLLRLIDELEWLRGLTLSADPSAVARWPTWARPVCAAVADVLAGGAGALDRVGGRPEPAARQQLDAALEVLTEARRTASEAFLRSLPSEARGSAVDSGPGPLQAHHVHQWAYAGQLIGQTVAAAAAADARPVIDRLLGRQPFTTVAGPVRAAERLAIAGVHRHSVWLQNSVRTGLGLGLAVFLAGAVHAQHGFWVVLGAMSILRTSAITTTSTVLRALLGTVLGFVVGGVLVWSLGERGEVSLWILLPICILVAGFAPETISFAAGQGAFTVVVVVLFNVISPTGWQVGLIRVEDVALGCVAGLIVGLLLWPRGSTKQLRGSLADAYREGAALLRGSVAGDRESSGAPLTAMAAAQRLDAVLRQFQSERRACDIRLETVIAAANGATRLRLTAEAVRALPPTTGAPGAGDILRHDTDTVADWFAGFGDAVDGQHRSTPAATLRTRTEAQIIEMLESRPAPGPQPGADPESGADPSLVLLWASLYIDDAAELAGHLMATAGSLISPPVRIQPADATPGRLPG